MRDHLLSIVLLSPFLGALVLLFVPYRAAKTLRAVALASALPPLAISVALPFLYDLAPGVGWYPYYLYLVHIVAFVTVLYVIFADKRFRLIPHGFATLGFFTLFYLWAWMNLQFTSASLLLGFAAVLLYAVRGPVASTPIWVMVIAGAMLGTGERVFMFEEMRFDVEIGGNHCSQNGGVKSVEAALGPMGAKRYPMEPSNHSAGTRMTLRMISCRSTSRWA